MLFCRGVIKFCEVLLEKEVDDDEDKEEAVVGYWSAFVWLAGLTTLIALLSEYVVDAIEGASCSWGLSVEFISIILLPIVGNATEHASALIFAYRNKLDISLGVALGSATQISMFVVPLNVAVAWIVGIEMDLDFKLLGTACLAFAVVITSFALQPLLLLGITIGVTLSIAFPFWLVSILIVILFLGTSSRSFCKGIEMWKQETIFKKELQNQQHESNVSPHTDYHILSLREEKSALETMKFNLRWKRVFILVSVWVAFLFLQIIKLVSSCLLNA